MSAPDIDDGEHERWHRHVRRRGFQPRRWRDYHGYKPRNRRDWTAQPKMTDYDITPPPDRLADRIQIRTAFSTHRGKVTKFMIQLEYWLDGDWTEVLRYDHDETAAGGHDVREEGLHRDVFREGVKIRSESVSGPIPANSAFEYAEEDLRENAERFIKRFEQWHDIRDRTDL